jgi:cyclic pyranopterin phosphate synthase
MATLIDKHDRHIDYLRISITDHCNLKCGYCTPCSERSLLPHNEILSYEEMFKAAQAAVLAGVSKIRITGGEPLVRKGIVGFCEMLSRIEGLKSLALTTNGVLLEDMAQALFDAGVGRVNVSLDTLKPDRFTMITGSDLFSRVVSGIRRAEKTGFSLIKINTVVMRGVNDDEVADLANLTLKKPYHVRFIELMPTKSRAYGNYGSLFMPVEEIVKKISQIGELQIASVTDTYGPARHGILPDARGKIGFIAPLSWHFCGSCNRLRLTADGKIMSCLFSEEAIDIKGPLRAGAPMAELIDIFRKAVIKKPRGHYLKENSNRCVSQQSMCAIGG